MHSYFSTCLSSLENKKNHVFIYLATILFYRCRQAAVSMLKQEYKENNTNLKQALDLSIKVLSKTLDTNKLTADKGA